jgi:hypothetical protein
VRRVIFIDHLVNLVQQRVRGHGQHFAQLDLTAWGSCRDYHPTSHGIAEMK